MNQYSFSFLNILVLVLVLVLVFVLVIKIALHRSTCKTALRVTEDSHSHRAVITYGSIWRTAMDVNNGIQYTVLRIA